MAEVVYLLSSKRLYHLSHEEVAIRLCPLLHLPGLKLGDHTTYLQVLDLYAVYAIDFENFLSLAPEKRQKGAVIYSYTMILTT